MSEPFFYLHNYAKENVMTAKNPVQVSHCGWSWSSHSIFLANTDTDTHTEHSFIYVDRRLLELSK